VTLRNMLTAYVPYGIHMVHAWMTEIKEYDVKAHGHGMVVVVTTRHNVQ